MVAPAKRGRSSLPHDANGVSNGLGARLRAAREQAGITVRGLARRVGVSPSLISQIERGQVTPSVGTLYSIANEMQLLLDDLFRDGEPTPKQRDAAPPASPGPVQRHDTRKAIRLASGVRWERLTATPDDHVEFLYVVYDVGSESCAEESLVRHGGKEYAYVLSGRLGVRIGFEEFDLGRGDSISFDADVPHRLWTIGTEPAVAIWVICGRHGDARAARTRGSRAAREGAGRRASDAGTRTPRRDEARHAAPAMAPAGRSPPTDDPAPARGRRPGGERSAPADAAAGGRAATIGGTGRQTGRQREKTT